MERLKMKKEIKFTLEKAWKKFLRNCKIEDLSECTINYYRNCYNYFLDYLEMEYGENEKCSLSFIKKDIVDDFILWLGDQYNMNNTTINTRIRGLRALLNYLMEENYLDQFKINILKTDQKIKETYSDSELKTLLKKPDLKDCTFAEYRNWVIENFL